jgi:SAM-dependent methyltransferase
VQVPGSSASRGRRALGTALLATLDRVLYRRPFEGRSAVVYRTQARPAFGDFDDRLLSRIAGQAGAAQRLLELGAGTAAFARAAKRRFPHLQVLAVEPSRELARAAAEPGPVAQDIAILRGRAEELPLADASISLAVCVSSIRHVADRRRAFAELRRVLAPGGALIIAELDPTASSARIAHHADRLRSRWLRTVFGPLIVRTAPPWQAIVEVARGTGFDLVGHADDPVQPLYLLELQ